MYQGKFPNKKVVRLGTSSCKSLVVFPIVIHQKFHITFYRSMKALLIAQLRQGFKKREKSGIFH